MGAVIKCADYYPATVRNVTLQLMVEIITNIFAVSLTECVSFSKSQGSNFNNMIFSSPCLLQVCVVMTKIVYSASRTVGSILHYPNARSSAKYCKVGKVEIRKGKIPQWFAGFFSCITNQSVLNFNLIFHPKGHSTTMWTCFSPLLTPTYPTRIFSCLRVTCQEACAVFSSTWK